MKIHTINPTSVVCDIDWDNVEQSILWRSYSHKANLFNILRCNNGPHRQNVGGGRLLSSLTPIVVVLPQLIESCLELLRKADFAFPSNAAHPSTVLITPTTSLYPARQTNHRDLNFHKNGFLLTGHRITHHLMTCLIVDSKAYFPVLFCICILVL